jgi:hypothetical protein
MDFVKIPQSCDDERSASASVRARELTWAGRRDCPGPTFARSPSYRVYVVVSAFVRIHFKTSVGFPESSFSHFTE